MMIADALVIISKIIIKVTFISYTIKIFVKTVVLVIIVLPLVIVIVVLIRIVVVVVVVVEVCLGVCGRGGGGGSGGGRRGRRKFVMQQLLSRFGLCIHVCNRVVPGWPCVCCSCDSNVHRLVWSSFLVL